MNVPHFGPVMQMGFVVPDLEAAMDHWLRKVGLGPFYVMSNIRFATSVYRGKPTDADISVAIAQWGEMQVELIQQFNDAPSIYRDFPGRDRGGLQHLGVMTQSVAADLERLGPLGIEAVQQGSTANGIRFAYVSTDYFPGAMIELIEHGPIDDFFRMVRKAAQGWDGRDPIRRL
ncbi:MAG: VOC family protein [Steroidobacteraceae bacterium]